MITPSRHFKIVRMTVDNTLLQIAWEQLFELLLEDDACADK